MRSALKDYQWIFLKENKDYTNGTEKNNSKNVNIRIFEYVKPSRKKGSCGFRLAEMIEPVYPIYI